MEFDKFMEVRATSSVGSSIVSESQSLGSTIEESTVGIHILLVDSA